MKILVGAAMLSVLIATGLEAFFLVIDALAGDYPSIWSFMSIQVDSTRSQGGVAFLVALVGLATWVCVLLAFWPLHLIIWAKNLSFHFVGTMLKRSAYACFGFWLGSTVIFFVIPSILLWIWNAMSLDDGEILPLGFETIFLILSLIFITIGQALERAEAIEDEMNQFL